MHMLRIIMSMGMGGTGKTSFVVLMTKYFIKAGERPLLLVDAYACMQPIFRKLHFSRQSRTLSQ